MSDKGFSYKSHGTNSNGKDYCARDYGSSAANPNAYHYSNRDGSYYYSNPNGSSYYNDGKGSAVYTPPAGNTGSSQSGGTRGGQVTSQRMPLARRLQPLDCRKKYSY